MDLLTSWLIQRMQWVYGFVVNDLHLPKQAGFIVIGLLIVIFFFDLVHIYKNRHKGNLALLWLLVLIFIPLGTLLYLLIGMRMLNSAEEFLPPPPPVVNPNQTVQPVDGTFITPSSIPNKAVPTTLGTIIAVIAWMAGAAAIVFFVIVGIALIRCANDPKCI